MNIALDATYSIGSDLTGVGVYSREILWGAAAEHPESRFQFCYRPHRFLRSFHEILPRNCRRRLLHEPLVPRSADVFHGLNQRLPHGPLRAAVATFHDLFVMTAEYSTPEFRLRFEEQARDAAQRADLIIAVSEFTASQVRECLGVEAARVRVVHHGVKPPRREPPEAAAREKIVLHVGAIQKRKNIARLVQAFERMPGDWRLVLAGAQGYEAGEALAAIAASPARARIELCGYVTEVELERWYERAAIFAFPSLDEGFGMPVLDAMAHGLAVVTSNRSALPEVSGEAALLVDPEDTDALGDQLRELAENVDLRKELGSLGRRRASGFSWQSAVSKTWDVYSELGTPG